MSEAIDKANKEELRAAVAILRVLRGWSQAELALATGLGASAVSRYESGAQKPSRHTLTRIAEAVGVRPLLVRDLLTWIRKARVEVLGGAFPNSFDDFIESSALELADAFSGLLRGFAEDLEASRRAMLSNRSAEELWESLQEVPVKDRMSVVEAVDELQSCEFCAFLCDECLDAVVTGNGVEALEMARLAVRSAEMSREVGSWKLRVKGYALAHLAAALQASGDLDAAEETMQRARTLWDAGDEPEFPSPLNEEQMKKLESALRAKRRET